MAEALLVRGLFRSRRDVGSSKSKSIKLSVEEASLFRAKEKVWTKFFKSLFEWNVITCPFEQLFIKLKSWILTEVLVSCKWWNIFFNQKR